MGAAAPPHVAVILQISEFNHCVMGEAGCLASRIEQFLDYAPDYAPDYALDSRS